MSRTRRPEGFLERRSTVLHVVPPGREDPVVVEATAADAWWGLPAGARERVSAFLAGASVAGIAFEIRGDDRLPADLARDLACGGVLLRAAFPGLVRSVVGVEGAGAQTVARVRCLGEQNGSLLRVVRPTGRRVVFDVVHRMTSGMDGDLRHAVAIDVRAIVLQLVKRR